MSLWLKPLSHPSKIVALNVNSELTVLSLSSILGKMLIQPLPAYTTLQELLPVKGFSFRSAHLHMKEDPGSASSSESTLPSIVLPKAIHWINP